MKPGQRLAVTLPIAGFLLTLPQVAVAGDELRASAEVTASAGYANSPFLYAGKDLGSPFVEIDAVPDIRLIGERSVISLTGIIDLRHFFRDYPTTTNYQGALDYQGNLSARLTAHAKVVYDSSIIGGFDAGAPVITTGTDLSLFGSRQRRRALDFAGDTTYALSARDSLTANAFYDDVRYSGVQQLKNYNGYGGGAGYSRALSQPFHLGVQASVARYVYQGGVGSAQVYTLQGTVSDQFSGYWNLTAALGGSYVERTIGGKEATPSGNLQLCRTSPRATFCALAREAVLPTVGGTLVESLAGANYSYLFSEHSKISLSGEYSHNGRPAASIPVNELFFSTSYVTAKATYDRTLRERVHFLATALFRELIGGTGHRPDDFGGSVGIQVKLGEYQ